MIEYAIKIYLNKKRKEKVDKHFLQILSNLFEFYRILQHI